MNRSCWWPQCSGHGGFGGEKFQQMEGGAIGLRETCTVARLGMQIFDQKWEGLVKEAGLSMKLYIRYMDDGRIFSQPINPTWEGVQILWIGGGGPRRPPLRNQGRSRF